MLKEVQVAGIKPAASCPKGLLKYGEDKLGRGICVRLGGDIDAKYRSDVFSVSSSLVICCSTTNFTSQFQICYASSPALKL